MAFQPDYLNNFISYKNQQYFIKILRTKMTLYGKVNIKSFHT